MVGILFHKFVYTVKPLVLHCAGITCDIFICSTANGINHYNVHSSTILHYFDSIFYYFNAF